MENKNEYELLNEMNVDLAEYEAIHLDEISKQKWKKRMKGKIGMNRSVKIVKQVIAASILIIAVVLGNQVYARLKFFTTSSLDPFFNENKTIKVNQNSINKSITFAGVMVTLKNVVLTNELLMITSEFSVKDKAAYKDYFKRNNLTLDGCKLNVYLNDEKVEGEFNNGDDIVTITDTEENSNGQFLYIKQYKKDGRFQNITEATGKINVKVEYFAQGDYLENDNYKYTAGWSLNFKTGLVKEKSNVCPLNEQRAMDDGTIITINKVEVDPIYIKVYYQCNDKQQSESEFGFIGKDNYGYSIECNSSGATNGSGVMSGYNFMNEKATKLTLSICNNLLNKNPTGEPITINLK